MAENPPSEFHITFKVGEDSLECLTSLSSTFTDEENILFKNRIPLVRTKHGTYELYKDLGEVVSETPGRYVLYRLLNKE